MQGKHNIKHIKLLLTKCFDALARSKIMESLFWISWMLRNDNVFLIVINKIFNFCSTFCQVSLCVWQHVLQLHQWRELSSCLSLHWLLQPANLARRCCRSYHPLTSAKHDLCYDSKLFVVAVACQLHIFQKKKLTLEVRVYCFTETPILDLTKYRNRKNNVLQITC